MNHWCPILTHVWTSSTGISGWCKQTAHETCSDVNFLYSWLEALGCHFSGEKNVIFHLPELSTWIASPVHHTVHTTPVSLWCPNRDRRSSPAKSRYSETRLVATWRWKLLSAVWPLLCGKQEKRQSMPLQAFTHGPALCGS